MSSHMINLFLCILSSLYLCFGLLYFCCRILPSKHKISLPLFLCLSVFMALLFWIKRESQHNGITIVFQLTTFLVTLFYSRHLLWKISRLFIFQLLIICPEIYVPVFSLHFIIFLYRPIPILRTTWYPVVHLQNISLSNSPTSCLACFFSGKYQKSCGSV